MYCPFCGSGQSSVIDKRAVKGTGEIRRRRECLKCKRRFTTYERVLSVEFMVIKRDGRREIYDRDKLKSGIARALQKRPAFENLEQVVSKIEQKVKSTDTKEIESRVLGQAVLHELKKLDKIAYLRFVSVYRQFKDPGDFTKELASLKI